MIHAPRKSRETPELCPTRARFHLLLLAILAMTYSSGCTPAEAVLSQGHRAGKAPGIQASFPDYAPKTETDSILDFAPYLGDELAKLPSPSIDNLGELLAQLEKHQANARNHPGRWTGGDKRFGQEREYQPSLDELLVSELGTRIELALSSATPNQRQAVFDAAGQTETTVPFGWIHIRHVDALGTGRMFYASPPKQTEIHLRK